jgi:hypothetical protein
MSGYVASARIVRAAPRLARPERAGDAPHWAAPDSAEVVVVDADDQAGREPTLVERCDAFRERVAQMTFFLLSPDSWR